MPAIPIKPRALRTLRMPLEKLLEFVDRQSPTFDKARLIHANTNAHQRVLVLQIECDIADKSGGPQPLEVAIDWNEVFGEIPCSVSGAMTVVEQITVSQSAADALQARVALLEEELRKNGLAVPR